jgi:hypothetical protein
VFSILPSLNYTICYSGGVMLNMKLHAIPPAVFKVGVSGVGVVDGSSQVSIWQNYVLGVNVQGRNSVGHIPPITRALAGGLICEFEDLGLVGHNEVIESKIESTVNVWSGQELPV